jgi:hypothetical protein
MIDIDKIHEKPYHFTLERIDPDNENVPEAIIPDDWNLHFMPEEMLTFRRFYQTHSRDVEFEEFNPDYFEEDCDMLLQYLYLSTSKEMQEYAAANPEVELTIYTYMLRKKLPYNLDDYLIIPPKELIDDALDNNFTDWVGIMNKLDLDNALFEADADL